MSVTDSSPRGRQARADSRVQVAAAGAKRPRRAVPQEAGRAAAAPKGRAVLGTNTKSATNAGRGLRERQPCRHPSRQARRLALRRALAADLALFGVSKRVRDCGVVPVAPGPLIARRAASGSGYIAGLSTCGLIHQCPWCGAKIRAGRALEVAAAVAAVQAMGGGVSMITLTLPHDATDSLKKLFRGLDAGWSKVVEGGPWHRLGKQIGYLGYYYAEEVTCSAEHCGPGWHPHIHLMLFHAAPLDAAGIVVVRQHVARQWHRGVTSTGLRAPLGDVGVRFQANADEEAIGRYITKVQESKWTAADELARGDVKDGRGDHRLVPFELVERFLETADTELCRRWREYVRATKGRPAIRSSRGLRKRLGLVAEATDSDLAAADADAIEDVARIPLAVWWRILAAGCEAEVYEAIAAGFDALNAVLAKHGCGWALAP